MVKQMDPSKLIDKQIASSGDWRGKTLTKLRKMIHDVDPKVTEEWKWNTAVFTHEGRVLARGPFKGGVKMNFFQVASLPDPHNLFNPGLKARRTVPLNSNKNTKMNEPPRKILIP